jgi:hypothetical protein
MREHWFKRERDLPKQPLTGLHQSDSGSKPAAR